MPPRLSVIVPIHNEQDNVRYFYDRARPVLEKLPVDWEIVFINDASTDGSLERILALRQEEPRVRVITLSRNFGYHAALTAGLRSRDSDLYAIVDVDCEDPPELLAQFHAALEKGAYAAYGIRSQRDEPRHIVFFRYLFYWINQRIADGPVMLWMAEFSMFTRAMREAVLAHKTTFPFLRAEMGYVGLRMEGVPYFRARRAHGASHYSFLRMAKFAVGGWLSSSTFPLRLGMYLAPLTLAGWLLLTLATGPTLARAAAWAAVLGFGYLLTTVPLLAIYLARTYKDVSARPVYYLDPARSALD
ncbi:MAG: glycosyltransferase family 2 protein [Elusimicrobia bacterium]|nr:glycosyltransferase family 2 protein [Elusimicrobiota bacterium]